MYPDTNVILYSLLQDEFASDKDLCDCATRALGMCAGRGYGMVISRLTLAEITTSCPKIILESNGAKDISDPVELTDFVNRKRRVVMSKIFGKIYDDSRIVFSNNATINQEKTEDQLAAILGTTDLVPNHEERRHFKKVRRTGVDDLIHLMTADDCKCSVFLTFDKMIEHIRYTPKNGLRTVTLDACRMDECLGHLERRL